MTTLITILCLAAIAFNVRFLVALRREREADLEQREIRQRREDNQPVDRAA